jgi:hypothetical protein
LDSNNQIVHGLWIGGALSSMEVLCIQSFLQNGHQFYLWTYELIQNIPDAVQIKDANLIVSENSIFSYNSKNKYGHGKGSYAGFSDIFRYKLLFDYGGWWTDMDITCLKPLDFENNYVFRFHHKAGAVGNLMKTPKGAPIMEYCYERAIKEVGQNNQNWMLPIEILNDGIKQFNLQSNIKNISNMDSFPLVSDYLIYSKKMNETWYVFHWMNEEFRRLNLPKNCFKTKSAIGILLQKNNVVFEKQNFKQGVINFIKLNRFYYLILNLLARIKWIFNNLGKKNKVRF